MAYLTPPPSPPRQASPTQDSSPIRLSSHTPPSSRHTSPTRLSLPTRLASPTRLSSPPRLSSPTPPSSRHSSPSRDPLTSRHTSPTRLSSPNRHISPKSLHRLLAHYLAKQKRIKHISKSKHLALENTCLQIANQRLQEELARVKASTTHSKEEASRLQNKIASLKNQNTELKRKIALQKPLVKVGVCIRKRFLEKTRSARYQTQELASVINDGNSAAHECYVAADAALFELGYMNAKENALPRSREYFRIDEDWKVISGEDVEKELRLETRYKDLFCELYGREAGESRSHPLGERERRVWDMIGTMMSCSEGFVLGEMDSGDSWFDRFNELVKELDGVKREIAEKCVDWDDRVKAFEASDEVATRLTEMHEIMKETRLWSWRQSRGLNLEKGVEMDVELCMDENWEQVSDEDSMERGNSGPDETELDKDLDLLMDE